MYFDSGGWVYNVNHPYAGGWFQWSHYNSDDHTFLYYLPESDDPSAPIHTVMAFPDFGGWVYNYTLAACQPDFFHL
jgi:hypothetical protein